jgi:hypothetical protein
MGLGDLETFLVVYSTVNAMNISCIRYCKALCLFKDQSMVTEVMVLLYGTRVLIFCLERKSSRFSKKIAFF